MSSKTQYKDALKIKDQIIREQKREIIEQRKTIQRQAHQINGLSSILNIKPKWWQFWKHL